MAYDDFEDKSFKIDENYFKVVIPDLDPGKTVPIQIRWQYADKTYSGWSASKNLEVPEIKRPEVENVVAVWDGTTLKITWDKTSELANSYQIYLTNGGTTMSWTKGVDKTQTSQSWALSFEDNKANFGGVFRTSFTGFLKTTYIDNTTTGVAFTTPTYSDAVCALTIADADWSLVSIDNGFTAAWTVNNKDYPTYDYTEVWVSDSQNGTYTREYTGKGPATIIVTTLNNNYVKIKHFSASDCSTAFSNVKTIKAYDPIEFDVTPPNEVTGVSASWSGNDIVIGFTMPATNPANRFRVFLTNSGQTRFFDLYSAATTPSTNQSVKITEDQLYGQFGEYYSSFTGVISSVDQYENRSTGVAFTVPAKSNPLTGITPTAVVTAVGNGYTVSWTLPAGASRAKVYEGSTTGFTPNDNTNLVYSGPSPALITKTTYTEVFVKVVFHNNFDQISSYSQEYAVTPLELGDISLIENPVKIATNGSIFTGDLDGSGQPIQSGARIFFNKTGVFIYDATNSGPTTQIIGDATTGSPTFITTNAKIANWTIYTSKIENTLGGGVTKYAGLSPSGTYAFWAGSPDPGGSTTAKFLVNQLGEVTARDIKVVGGEITVGGNGTYAGSPFAVNTSGQFKSTDAEINGVIRATSGVLGSIDIGGTINGTPVDGQLRVTAGGGTVEIGKYASSMTGTGITATTAGLQITNTSNGKYVQLDPTNGIIAVKGYIGGWAISSNSITKNNTTLGSDGSITAGSGGEFTVTSAGALTATGATILGTIRASGGGFGTFSGTTLTKGWTITPGTITSTGSQTSTGQVVLDGENGAISGGKISGTKVMGSAFYIGSSESATDYILSNGTFSLGGGKITYNGSTLSVTNTEFALNVTSNEDGTFGDPTVVQDTDNGNKLTIGRAFFYGGLTDPRVAYFGGPVTARWQVANGAQGSAAFNVGDVWLQRQ